MLTTLDIFFFVCRRREKTLTKISRMHIKSFFFAWRAYLMFLLVILWPTNVMQQCTKLKSYNDPSEINAGESLIRNSGVCHHKSIWMEPLRSTHIIIMRSSARKKKLWLRVSKCIILLWFFLLVSTRIPINILLCCSCLSIRFPRCIIIIFDYFSSPCGSALSPAFAKNKNNKTPMNNTKRLEWKLPILALAMISTMKVSDEEKKKERMKFCASWDEKKILNFRFFLSHPPPRFADAKKYHTYYQWVCFVLFFQGNLSINERRLRWVCEWPTTSNLIQSQDERSLWNWLSNALHISEREPDSNA